MHFSAPVLVAFLAAIAGAAPTSPAKPSVFEKREGHCENSSFQNGSSGGSPLISDCQVLSSNIAGSGSWYLSPWHSTILTFGTCAFGGSADLPFTRIGNDDVRDLIRDSIAKFSWQGKVGASGAMKCEGNNTPTRWSIYHT